MSLHSRERTDLIRPLKPVHTTWYQPVQSGAGVRATADGFICAASQSEWQQTARSRRPDRKTSGSDSFFLVTTISVTCLVTLANGSTACSSAANVVKWKRNDGAVRAEKKSWEETAAVPSWLTCHNLFWCLMNIRHFLDHMSCLTCTWSDPFADSAHTVKPQFVQTSLTAPVALLDSLNWSFISILSYSTVFLMTCWVRTCSMRLNAVGVSELKESEL